MELVSRIFGNVKSIFLWAFKIVFLFIGIKIFDNFVSKWTNQEILKWILALAVLIWFEVSFKMKDNNDPLLDKMEDLKNEFTELKHEVEFLQSDLESLQKKKNDQWI